MKRIAALALMAITLAFATSCASAPPKAPPAAVAAPAPAAPAAAASPAPAGAASGAAVAKPAEPQPATAAQTAALAVFMKPYASATKECRAAIEKAGLLALQGKWKSAYDTMDAFDQANADPFALAMKTSIILRGLVRTSMDQAFALVDLADGEDLDTYRNGAGDYQPINFDPSALAVAQVNKGVAMPGILSKELGDYYIDVLGRFSGQWIASDDDILSMIAIHYDQAYAAGVFDAASLVNHAETLVRLNRGKETDALYAKAIELDPTNPASFQSYAASLALQNRKAEALPQVDKAIQAYGEDPAKINAIAMGARLAAELGDAAKKESYFAIADAAYPDNPLPGILRHLVATEAKDKATASAVADDLVSKYGSNPNVVRTLISTWFSIGDEASAREFLTRNIAKGGDDMTVGTLDFYLAVLISQNSPPEEADRVLALKALDEAQKRFAVGLDPSNDVFSAIADLRDSLQPQPPEAAPAPQPTPSP